MSARFKVRQDLAYWGFDGNQFTPGEEHEVSGYDQIVADAAGAGILYDVVWDEGASYTIETDSESLVKQFKAIEDGSWSLGNTAQSELDAEQGGLIELGGTQ